MRDDAIAAGWFDTRRRGTRRWWNGSTWTEHIAVRGRETTLAADRASVRRKLLVTEIVLVLALVAAILIALWGSLPVVTVRPVIVVVGTVLVVAPMLIARQLRRVALPVRRPGVPTRH
ncbi:DUF2510 domain-containing protein [Microbacterium sp. MYb66]|uniref:DUF2510 domain-containing protein n=1 Tax=Microbacterium sp. MYb66 TaxID=1848692 RepID=UPI00215839EC|nr:DUF2510 domain-containing protein [Microbacterium sp. MYb66]